MGIYSAVDSQIKKYGSSVRHILGERSEKTKAFVQPLRYRNKIYIGGEYHKLGFLRREKYLYIGCCDCPLTENRSLIEFGKERYLVKRREVYYVGEEPVYVWAILTPYGGAREDEFESD